MKRAFGALALCLAHAVLGASAFAQTRPAPPAPGQARPASGRDRFEASIGGLWIGGAGLGSAQADLRANNLTPTPFRLFTTETDAAGAPGFDVRFGYWLTRTVAIEGGFVRVRPELRTSISADAEGAPELTVAEQIDQYFIDAAVVWRLDRFRFGRTVPFVGGGAGYLRQLHEGLTLVETGQVYHVGGGIRHPLLTDAGWLRTIGLRLDGRVYVLTNGIELEDRPRTHGAFSGSIFVTF